MAQRSLRFGTELSLTCVRAGRAFALKRLVQSRLHLWQCIVPGGWRAPSTVLLSLQRLLPVPLNTLRRSFSLSRQGR